MVCRRRSGGRRGVRHRGRGGRGRSDRRRDRRGRLQLSPDVGVGPSVQPARGGAGSRRRRRPPHVRTRHTPASGMRSTTRGWEVANGSSGGKVSMPAVSAQLTGHMFGRLHRGRAIRPAWAANHARGPRRARTRHADRVTQRPPRTLPHDLDAEARLAHAGRPRRSLTPENVCFQLLRRSIVNRPRRWVTWGHGWPGIKTSSAHQAGTYGGHEVDTGGQMPLGRCGPAGRSPGPRPTPGGPADSG